MKSNTKLFSRALMVCAGLTPLFMSVTASAQNYSGPEITFDQVFESPDDQDLNFNYARQQADRGDLLGAASSLERMLYSQPNWDSARLFYAIVLHKLDDKQAAMREFKILDARDLTTAQRTQVDAYMGRKGAGSSERSALKGQISIGLRYDDNAGLILQDGLTVAQDTDDTAILLQGAIAYAAPIGGIEALDLRAGLRGSLVKYDEFDTADSSVLGGHVGLGTQLAGWRLSADFEGMSVNLDGDQYLSQLGPTVKAAYKIDENLTLNLRGGAYYQDFSNIARSAVEQFRSGQKYTVSAGLTAKVADNTKIGGSIGHELKKATADVFGYEAYRISAHMFNGFENGVYLKVNGNYRNLTYDAPIPFGTNPNAREDERISARAGIGVSLANLGEIMGFGGSSMAQTYLEGAWRYTDRDSNLTQYDFDNSGFELKLTHEF